MSRNQGQPTEAYAAFRSLVTLENAFRYWWIIALGIIFGGIIGWLRFSLNPPIYEATAQFSVGIDYTSTAPLTQYEEDLAVNWAGNYFTKDEVLQQVADQLSNEELPISLADLKKKVSIERKFSIWTIHVRDEDPQEAERIAAIWFTTGANIFQQSALHAVQAERIDRYLRFQQDCLENTGLNEPAFMPCGTNLAEIQRNFQDAGIAYQQALQASRKFYPKLLFGLIKSLTVSPTPVPYGRNQYVFLGCLFGLAAGVAVTESGAAKFIKRSVQ